MKMTVKLFGTLRSHYPEYDHGAGIELESDSKIRVNQVIEELGLPVKQIGIVTINGNLSKAEDIVPDNSEVKVFQTLAGG